MISTDIIVQNKKHIENTWGQWDNCPPNEYVTRFKVRYHNLPANGSDHFATTGISMTCSDNAKTQITSDNLHQWGEWLQESDECTAGYFKARGRIDTSSNSVRD